MTSLLKLLNGLPESAYSVPMNTNRTAHVAALLALLPSIAAAAAAASSIGSAHIRGLRVLLAAAQGNLCCGCGKPLAGAVELCHVVPSTNERTGYGIAPGAVYAGHKVCNAYEQGKDAATIVRSMARPDLVVTGSHPDRAACLAASGPGIADVAALRDGLLAE